MYNFWEQLLLYFSGGGLIGGWRYCRDKGNLNPNTGEATKVWSNHQGIVCYYAEAPADGEFLCSYNTTPPINDFKNLVISVEPDQHGQHLATFNLFVPKGDYPRRLEVQEVLPRLRETGTIALDQNPNASALYDRFINPNSGDTTYLITNLVDVRRGDYVFVERSFNTSQGHGYLVAGWGQIMSCPSALSKIWTFESPISSVYAQLYPDFVSSPINVVPYVVDFPGSVDSDNQTQRPRPRPFYCADYIDPATNPDPVANQKFQRTIDDGFAFFAFPVSIAVRADQLYVSPLWFWSP